MRVVFLAVLFLSMSSATFGQTFESTVGMSGEDIFQKVVKSQDGGWLTCGQSFMDWSSGESWAMKFDASGNVMWEYFSPVWGFAIFSDVVELSSGEWVFVGTSQLPGPWYDISWKVVRLSPQGELVSEFTFDLDNMINLRAIRQRSDGSFVVLGWQGFGIGGKEAVLFSLDSSFNLLETVTWGEGDTRTTSIVSDGDSGWFVAGTDLSMSGDNTDTWLLYHLDENFDVVEQIAHPFSSMTALNELDLVGSELLLSGADKDENNDWRPGIARIPVDLSTVEWLSSDIMNAHASGVYFPSGSSSGWSVGYGQHPQMGTYQPYMQAFSQDLEWSGAAQWIPIDVQHAVVLDVLEHEGLLALAGQTMDENFNLQGWLKVMDAASDVAELPPHQEWSAAYPNPTCGMVQLKCPSEGVLHWSDQLGRSVDSDVLPLDNGWFDVSRLASGVYHVRLTGQGQAPVQTVVIASE